MREVTYRSCVVTGKSFAINDDSGASDEFCPSGQRCVGNAISDVATSVPVVPGLADLTVLAHGGYATVYRAVQTSVDREVAVKVENWTVESDHDRRRFLREARAAARMSSHPHVVDLFDIGVTDNGHPYMIMELCEGTFADRMRSVPLSAHEAHTIGWKIADALADAHALGVLHRDVKPANVLITRFGEPALADFGLAMLVETREPSVDIELTPAYAAPEMFYGLRPVPASDVYGLCATLYALLQGRPPRWRHGHKPTVVPVADMFAEYLPDLPGVPAELTALIRRGMANDAKARPSAAQLRDELAGGHGDPDPAMVLRTVHTLVTAAQRPAGADEETRPCDAQSSAEPSPALTGLPGRSPPATQETQERLDAGRLHAGAPGQSLRIEDDDGLSVQT